MPLLLHIETATEICSVALSESGKLLSLQEERSPNSHSATLTLLIEKVFADVGLSMQKLEAVAVSAGPGSFTGLRIGVSAAKGLCYALDKPLIAVPTMQGMTAGAVEQMKNKDALYCPVLNSIKQEVYAGLYDFNLEEIIPASPAEHTLTEFIPRFNQQPVYFFGTGAKKIPANIYEKAETLPHFSNSARDMIRVGENHFEKQQFVSVEYFEPLYVKGFVVRVPLK
ncbi:MAG: tRNA (adenosine(37)-N6)-threonylcarbamoyltransferase complex dimerization subunit type 1 TsaB [Chitinophagales bacterium]|nr:tRNA (adenosine(37)-N6)-threonylcarbamoyltransferase complex dimerization subunit type 1 TsaB [Chitinophagales bacterium]